MYFCLSSIDLFIFSARIFPFYSYFCVIYTLVLSFSTCLQNIPLKKEQYRNTDNTKIGNERGNSHQKNEEISKHTQASLKMFRQSQMSFSINVCELTVKTAVRVYSLFSCFCVSKICLKINRYFVRLCFIASHLIYRS